MDVHTVCLINGTTLYYVLAFYTSEYLLPFFTRCSSILCLFSCAAPAIGREGTTIGIRARSTWRYLCSSLIFRSSMVSSISAGGRLGWTPSWPRASWRKYYWRWRKSLKTWKKKLDRSWMREPWWLFSFAWQTKSWMSFLRRKQHSRCGSDFRTIIWKVVGK